MRVSGPRDGAKFRRSFLRAESGGQVVRQQTNMDLHPKQFVRVNVTALRNEKVEKTLDRNFSVDPRTITLDRLRHLIARALDIREEFSILVIRSKGKDPLPLSCDWDLEGALSEEPRIDLLLELQPKEPGFDEWDIICPADVPVAGHEASTTPQQRRGTFLENILFHIRTPSSPYVPLTESEFEKLADWACPLRYAVYRADGAQETLRSSLWMHLLDVFPTDAGDKGRQEFVNRKAEEYYGLRHSWQKLVQAGTIPAILHDLTSLIRKDVRRTDRVQGLDERALYNILTTYAVHHPSVGYCQGMSDLLSPLLHIMKTESRAYLAFCGLMQRMRDNFRQDGRSVRIKFRHLRRAIRTHDPQLYDYLSEVCALDLLFCYRWLLLDLKREFPYEEMMRLTEVLWSTLRPLGSEKGVDLYEERFPTASVCHSLREKEVDPRDRLTFTEDHFGQAITTREGGTPKSLKRWATMSRRQSIAQNIESEESSTEDEDGGILHYRRRRRRSRNVCRSWSGQDSALNRQPQFFSSTVHEIQIDNWLSESLASSIRRRHGSSDSNYESNISDDEPSEDEAPSRERSEGYISGQDSHRSDEEDSSLNSFDSADTYFNDDRRRRPLLPPPTRLGDGKPFLIFLCLTMILNHRDAILSRKMDANEIGIYFDHMVRKHRLADVLPRAKEMFAEYLRTGWTEDE